MGGVRVFLDSNVILSGLLSSKGSPKILLDLLSIEVPLLKGMTGQYNLDEIERNLRQRFPDMLAIYREFLPKLYLEIMGVPSYSEIAPLLGRMSPKDLPVLVAARNGNSDYLITGDKKGFPRELLRPVIGVTPTEFLGKIFSKLIQGTDPT